MTAAKVTKDLSAWREILAASEDSICMAEIVDCLRENHPEKVDSNTPSTMSCAMAAMLTATFSVESVVNDILQSVVKEEAGFTRWEAKWAELEKQPLKEKIRYICRSLELPSPLGGPPFQIIDEMCDFRTRMVHAKPEIVEIELPADEAFGGKAWGHPSLETPWEQACTIENAVRFKNAAWGIASWFIEKSGGKYGPNIATINVVE